jgi:competence protein ComEA
MKIKTVFSSYFSFSRKERIGGITILISILALWFLPGVIFSPSSTVINDTAWIAQAKKLELHDPGNTSFHVDKNSNAGFEKPGPADYGKPELFYFDPNETAEADWRRLGVSEKTTRTILNYLNKGGRFYKPVDLKKVYGLRPADYDRLEPYVRIKNAMKQRDNRKEPETKKPFSFTKKDLTIDINASDTSAWIALPGIGSKLALRIVNFRERLGGFYAVQQVAETFGLADSTFQKIKPLLKLANTGVRKINVNTAPVDELRSHPYIRWNLANAVVEYRKQHGDFLSVGDLKKIPLVTDDAFQKLQPYIITQ